MPAYDSSIGEGDKVRAACPECGKTHRVREEARWCLSVANDWVVHNDL